jgi:hypothetical protein
MQARAFSLGMSMTTMQSTARRSGAGQDKTSRPSSAMATPSEGWFKGGNVGPWQRIGHRKGANRLDSGTLSV